MEEKGVNGKQRGVKCFLMFLYFEIKTKFSIFAMELFPIIGNYPHFLGHSEV
jgi:hypothetical protein